MDPAFDGPRATASATPLAPTPLAAALCQSGVPLPIPYLDLSAQVIRDLPPENVAELQRFIAEAKSDQAILATMVQAGLELRCADQAKGLADPSISASGAMSNRKDRAAGPEWPGQNDPTQDPAGREHAVHRSRSRRSGGQGLAQRLHRPKTWPEFRDLVVFLAGSNPALPSDSEFSQAHFDHVCQQYGDPAQLAKYNTFFVDSITVLSRLCLTWAKGQPATARHRR